VHSRAASPRARNFASNYDCGHLKSIADREVLEGTSAEVEGVELAWNPSSCVKDVLTWGRFVMDSAHVDSELAVVETAPGDMLIQHAVDSIPYPVPNHDVPS